MLLDSLLAVIAKLKERIHNHASQLRQSEALTRYALVDPLLRTVGWDTEDPAQVVPEYKLGSGFADYALFSGGKPAVMIEAKKLDANLSDAASQGISYCITDGIKYFAVTDGRKWNLYETHLQVPIADKKIVSFDLMDPSSGMCLEVLALWRPSVQDGGVQVAQTPLLAPQNAHSEQRMRPGPPVKPAQAAQVDDGGWRSSAQLRPARNESAPRISTPSAGDDWVSLSLSEFQPTKDDARPTAVRFPNGSVASVKHWGHIPCEVVRWLAHDGRLDENCIPVQIGKRYILSRQHVHPTGRDFRQPKHIGEFWVEADYTARDSIRNARTIIEKAGKGVDPSQLSLHTPK